MSNKTTKRTGSILIWSSIGLVILLGIVFRYLSQETTLQRIIQRNVLWLEDGNTQGLFVYRGDSLVFWNSNEVNPRLLRRKVSLGSDTICHLNNGYYFVNSYQKNDTSYYEFSLLSTDYPINNPYTENYSPIIPEVLDADISFHREGTEMPIYNRDGRILAYLTIYYNVLRKSLFWIFLLPLALILIGVWMLFQKRRDNNDIRDIRFERDILVILIIAILSTYIYSKIVTKHENAHIRDMAENLIQKRDTSFEASYSKFVESVQTDVDFRNMVFGESNVLAEVVLDYSKEFLFDEVMNAYTVTLTLCAPGDEITVQPSDYVVNCEDYFIEKVGNNKQIQVGEGLYFMDYYTLDPNYLGKMDVVLSDSLLPKTLYYEFYKPVAPEGFSYDYSVANYRDGLLVYKYGRYVYPNFVNRLELNFGDFSYSRRYKHYAVSHGENDTLIISAPIKGFSEATAPFAMFFLGLLLPYLLVIWLRYSIKPRKWRDRTFRQRLQTVILLTLGISFLAIGPVSVLYMRSLYNKNTAGAQFETTRTMANEMRNDIDFESLLQYASRDRWNELLQRYANTFFTDINLYQLNGQLLATTRPEIIELNLQTPLMNADAYRNMHHNHELYFTHQEHLGKAVYESAYLPLTDPEGNTLAYLNAPFFSSTSDLQKEIKNFVLTYLNIILLLLVVALIFVLRLTKRLTQPLALIQNKLSGLKIDQKNEPIEWKSNDEIGALVKQYNQLIVELEESAAELRRTAAESAWRGVARQVAHEIKNSLTPMRLSVQMLQRAAEQQGGEIDERFQRTSRTLLEQIDALSDIASSFSSYAKLPENHPQPLDLAELVGNLVNLYDNADNINFEYKVTPNMDYIFNGDKTNLNSAIGNIIKNATQAIGDKEDGKIEVILKPVATTFVVTVKDNGKGIKEEDKKMIFVPNFTTKSGGSGVGLSLAYNIIQSAGGTITFESKEGEGTTFVIELPRSAK